jgi:NAD(P)-dependent dehydrogenase (short-subunit alcohol dehydrogenase family)
LTTKLVVITGVTRGLGRAMAAEFIAQGHTVLGCGQSTTAIAQLQQQFPEPHQFTAVNVASDAEVKAWCDRLLAHHTAPDLLINNAGVINSLAPLWEVPEAEVSQLIDVNIKGVVNVIRHFTPAMIRQGSGVIVNFSSGWGRSTSPEVAPYCASKWAIEGLTQAFAQELPQGLAAIALNPGIIHTDMLDTCFGKSASSYVSPERWAKKAVPFLLKLRDRDNGAALTVPS